MRIVLASSSPRRADLLRAAGIACVVSPVPVDETFHPNEQPEAAVVRLAEAKARAAWSRHREAFVVGADTTVVCEGRALAKPGGPAEAAAMLQMLAGRSHDVLTGVCVAAPSGVLVHTESTRVYMMPMSQADIDWYVSTPEPYDKAGGYAIQGVASRFINRIEGSYSNVVGLPVAQVCGLLARLGCDILEASHNHL